MTTDPKAVVLCPTPMTRAKLTFFFGLGLLILLFYNSLLRGQEMSGYGYATLLAVTLAALLFDYVKVGHFLTAAGDSQRSHELAVESALTATVKSPLLLKLFKTELLTLYYAFFAKFDRSSTVHDGTRFSYANASNTHDVYLFVAFSQLPFLPLIHIFVEYKVGPGPAWLITVLTLWSVIWYLAQVEAAKLRPLELTDDHLRYRFALLWAADIPLSKIKKARGIEATETLNPNDMFTSPAGSTKNVLLEFESPVLFSGPYMQRRREDTAAICVDKPSSFLRHLALKGVAAAYPGP